MFNFAVKSLSNSVESMLGLAEDVHNVSVIIDRLKQHSGEIVTVIGGMAGSVFPVLLISNQKLRMSLIEILTVFFSDLKILLYAVEQNQGTVVDLEKKSRALDDVVQRF